jgi:hypothetical protein
MKINLVIIKKKKYTFFSQKLKILLIINISKEKNIKIKVFK